MRAIVEFNFSNQNISHCSPSTIPSPAEPHPMTCGHSPLPPRRWHSFGRGAQCRNVAHCSPTTNPSATPRSTSVASRTSPHDLRSFPSPSQSLALLRERGTMPQRRSLFAHDKPLCNPSPAEPHSMTCGHSRVPPSRWRSFGRGAQCRNVAHCKQHLQAVEPARSLLPLAQRAQRVPGRGVDARAAGVRSFTLSSTCKLLNLRAHCNPSLKERSDCPGEGWTRERPGRGHSS